MDRAQLLDDLTQNLSESELKTLCGRLGVSFQELAGYHLPQKAEKLFDRLDAAERLQDLVNELIRIRPYLAGKYEHEDRLNWLDQVSTGMGWAIRPQITVDLSDLEDIANSDRANVPAAELPHTLTPLYESPTATWPVDSPAIESPSETEMPPGVNDPYQIGGIVADPDRFYGRFEARRRLRARLQNMGSSVIIGLSHSGKSSLLHYISHHEALDPTWRFLFAFVRLSQPVSSLADLFDLILQDWYRAMGRDRWPAAKTPDEFARQVRFLGQSGYRPVICLDDFANLLRTPSIISEELLETWQELGNGGRLALIFTGSRPLTDLLRSAGYFTRFGTIFTPVDIGLLTADAAQSIVLEPALNQGVTIADATVAELIAYCGAHPFYLQLGASCLFPALWRDGNLSDAVRSAFKERAVPFWLELWQQLTPLQQKVLSEPLVENPPLVVVRQYRQLARTGILVTENGRYRVFSHGFAEWIAERFGSTQQTGT